MSPFDRLRARGLIGQSLALTFAGIVLLVIPWARPAGAPIPYGFEIAFAMLTYAAVVVVLVVRGRAAGLSWRALFGPAPTRHDLPLSVIVVPVLLLTMGAVTAVYVPLSYVAPQFVERMILQDSTLFDARTIGEWLWLMLLTVVVAPFVEELFFRGFLLQRWARRWGTATGVVASSALFAVLHGEWLGHFVFGVVMALLYLETRRLWMPMLAHAVNNGVVALFALGDVLRHAPPDVTTLADLRAEWPSGLGALAAGVVLMYWCLQHWWPNGRWRSVLRGPVPYDAYDASATLPATTSTS